MKVVLVAGFAGWVCLFSLLLPTYAQNGTTAKKQFYIGVLYNRAPYTYLDKEHKPKGLLVNTLDKLCGKVGADCVYVGGEFNQLLDWFKSYELDVFVMLDGLIPPELGGHTKLTSPLCEFEPVFISRKDNPLQDFAGATIGVDNGSSLHLYLLDKYKDSHLRPYFTLENGIFDLVSKRIDALFTDKAFFQVRVAMTVLGNETHPDRLLIRETGKHELSATAMRLVMREQDTELLAMFEQAIQAEGNTQPCSDLLAQQNSKAKSRHLAKGDQ